MSGIRAFRDKVVVVTGAGSGIGRATALAFAGEGADLVISDQHEKRLLQVSDEIRSLGSRCMSRQVDVADKNQIKAFSEDVILKRGKVDILFNNAGVAIGGNFSDTGIEDFEWIYSINVWGVIYCIKYFLPHMISQRSGHIVNTSSIAGLAAAPGMSAYCSTKFAVAGLGESLRAELKRHNIGVTTICPGVINTRILADGRMHLKQEQRGNTKNMVHFYKKYGWPPERVAKAVLKAVRKNRSVVPVGPEAWFQWFGKRFSQKFHDASAAYLGRMLMK